jgi:hypothetical protein
MRPSSFVIYAAESANAVSNCASCRLPLSLSASANRYAASEDISFTGQFSKFALTDCQIATSSLGSLTSRIEVRIRASASDTTSCGSKVISATHLQIRDICAKLGTMTSRSPRNGTKAITLVSRSGFASARTMAIEIGGSVLPSSTMMLGAPGGRSSGCAVVGAKAW